MPEAKSYPGQPGWENAAIGGGPIAIFFDDLKLVQDGGFGWDGTAWLVCPTSPTSSDHRAPITIAADGKGWTPGAIIGELPLHAPCNDNGDNPWRIEIQPSDPALYVAEAILGEALDQTIWCEPIHIWRLPWGEGYPPVGHR